MTTKSIITNTAADIAIIGGGVCGMFCVFEAGMLNMSCTIIDSLGDLGGQCSALYPEKPIYDIPAHPKILAADLVKNLQQQMAPFKPEVLLGQTVDSFTRNSDGTFTLRTSAHNTVTCKVIIIAAGAGAFGPNRPPLSGIEKFENKSIFYYVKNPEIFANKQICIAGGGDSAADWAIYLSETASKVWFMHRRDKFRCAASSEERIRSLALKGKIELVIPYQAKEIVPSNDGSEMKALIVEDLNGNTKTLPADYFLAFFGLSMNLGPIADWGFSLKQKHIQVDQSTMKTNIENVYAIGDIATYQGKLKLILTGFAEAATAIHSAYNVVNPDKALHFEYSTTKGISS